jgi:hypothetical protein
VNLFSLGYTVDIFSGEPGESAQLRFALKIFGQISFDLGEISPNQQILRLKNGRNSPNSEEIGAKLNCADLPILGEKNNYCVKNARSSKSYATLIHHI